MKRIAWEEAGRVLDEEEREREEQRTDAWEAKRAAALSLAELKQHDGKAAWDKEEVRCLCPRPACTGHTRTPEHRSLAANTKTGVWKCWRCDEAGLLAEFWTYTPLPKRTAKERRKADAVAAVRGELRQPAQVDESKWPAPETQEEYAAAFPDSPAARYLEGRGIPSDVAAAHGCGYCADWHGVARVTFPVLDAEGVLVAHSGRACVPCAAGLKQRVAGNKSAGVFNLAALEQGAVFVTEAPIDALSLAVFGYHATTGLGTEWPDWLRRALAFKTVFAAFDADEAGDKAADKLAADLLFTKSVIRLRPPEPHKDWNAALCGLGRDGLAAWLAEHVALDVPATTTRPPAPAAPPPPAVPLLVYSRTLAETVRVVETAAKLPVPSEGEYVTYTRKELELLDGQPADVLRNAHLLKRHFGGFYIGQAEGETPPPAETGTLF